MNKQVVIIVSLLVVLAILFFGSRALNIAGPTGGGPRSVVSLPSFKLPSLRVPTLKETPISEKAWAVFQDYLKFAQAHDKAGVVSLSHQTSEACNDQTRETECFALMDNVYAIANQFTREEFKYVQADSRQILMYTEGPVVAILYFTVDTGATPKILGLGFCLEDSEAQMPCVETDQSKRDKNGNGWWDNVEALFY